MNSNVRRFVLAGSVTALTGAVALIACGFPSPQLLDSTTGDSGSMDGSTDGPRPVDDAGMPFDPDAKVTDDAGKKVDISGCPIEQCDCDGDTYPDRTRFGCADAGGADSGPGDCDDSDTRLRPDQDYVKEANPPNSGDWNCDGKVEKFYKNVNVSCSGLLDSTCTTKEGYTTDPACGEAAKYVYCKLDGLRLNCIEDTTRTETRIQACR